MGIDPPTVPFSLPVTTPQEDSFPLTPEESLRSPDRSRKPLYRVAGFWLWLSLFLPVASVYHPNAGWNVNTRLDLVFAMVDQGTVRIDDYHDFPPYDTGDKALFDGHYYCDKIIGVSLLAIPPYGILKLVMAMVGSEPDYTAAHWWMRSWSVGGLAAGVGVLLWVGLLRLGIPRRQAFLLVNLLFFGSLLFPYSTVFYPYLPGAFFTLAAWILIEESFRLPSPPDEKTPGNSGFPLRKILRSFFVGLLLGMSLLMDYIFGLVVVALAIRSLWLWRRSGFFLRAAAAAIGGGLPLAVFAVYTLSIFGSLSIPYQYEADPLFKAGMSQGFMGITGFQGAALWYCTVHPYRGLFFWSPILAVGVVGCIRMIVMGWRPKGMGGSHLPEPLPSIPVASDGGFPSRDASRGVVNSPDPGFLRWVGSLGLLLGMAYLVFNASYYMWWGGWAMGPRLLIPAIPFLGLGVAGVWTWGRGGRAACVAAGIASVVLMLPVALVDPQTPMWLHTWPELLHPTVDQNLAAEQFLQMMLFSRGRIDPTLGSLLGFPGLWSLIPVLLLWIAPSVVFLRVTKRHEKTPAATSIPTRG